MLFAALFLFSCTTNSPKKEKASEPTEQEELPLPKRINITYHLQAMKDSGIAWLRQHTVANQNMIISINRVDRANIAQLDTIVVPDTFVSNFNQYSPFPDRVAILKDVTKLILFSYPAQAFGVYENGRLIRWGPTSLGRENAQTPTGLFFANWKAEETQSTVDDEWILKWNFNIANKEGIGWHEYSLPGYPASHSCLRLLAHDAMFLYNWADQWVLETDEKVKAHGTPVIVFGSYPFGSPKPWLALAQNGNALDISEEELTQIITPKHEEVIAAQQNLKTVLANRPK